MSSMWNQLSEVLREQYLYDLEGASLSTHPEDVSHAKFCSKFKFGGFPFDDELTMFDDTLEKFEDDTSDESEEKTNPAHVRFTSKQPVSSDLHKETMDVNGFQVLPSQVKFEDASEEETNPPKMISDDSVVSSDLLKETIDVNGFQVLPSQVKFANDIFESHPDIASEFRPKHPLLKRAYMSVLLSLIEILHQSPRQISSDDLVGLLAALGSATEAGFKLDWLEKKLNQVSEKKEKEKACETRIKEIEQALMESKQKCSDLETELEKEKAELLGTRTF